jgi:hypothetical protein
LHEQDRTGHLGLYKPDLSIDNAQFTKDFIDNATFTALKKQEKAQKFSVFGQRQKAERKKSQMRDQMDRIHKLVKSESKQKFTIDSMLDVAQKIPTEEELHTKLDAQYEQSLLGDLRR